MRSLQVRKFGSLPAVRTTCHIVWTPIRLKHHPSERCGLPSGPSSVSRSFELLQLAFVLTFQQYVWTTLSVRQTSRFLSKIELWEDCCNRPDDVDSLPDALIHKASIAIQIQTSGRQSSWSGHVTIRYGNCVHQIYRPDEHPPGPDAQILYMEITCSGRATVRTRLISGKNFSKILGQLIVQLSIRTAHYYRSDDTQFLSSQTLI
jgi:hypothetical protein